MKRFKVVNNTAVQIGQETINGNDLVENLYQALGEYITTGKVKNSSHIAKVLTKQLTEFESKAEQDPENLGNIKSLMNITKETSDYFLKKQAQDKDFTEYMLYRDLFSWQRNVWNSSSKRIALAAGRRSGKSYLTAALLLKHCIEGYDNIQEGSLTVHKKRLAYYIGLTHERAVSVVWQPLKDLIDKAHIPYSRIDNGQHIITLSNGASIVLYGNNSKAEREKLRGIDASMFVIDEMQSQTGVAYILESIIQPIITGRNGVIILAGTAPISAGTYWERVMKEEEGYDVFKATMMDNPTIPDYSNALAKVLEENHWTEDNITYRREYLGEIAYDTNRLIYPVRSYYDSIPKQQVESIWVGVDFGYVDATAIAAIVVLSNGQAYLTAEFKMRGMSATQIIEKIHTTAEYLSRTYNIDYSQVHIRTDNNEPNMMRDIQNQYPRMDIQNASKRGETAQIALVNDMLLSKDLLILQNGEFDNECNRAVWKVLDNGNIRYGEIDDEAYHGDMTDAVKYAVSSYYGDKSWIKKD